MPQLFLKPESALRRAKEFEEVGKKQQALDVLYEALRSKRQKSWQPANEDVIRMYLRLCIELRQSQTVKEGLHQYKLMCQTVNPNSLENVIADFFIEAEQNTKKAQDESKIATPDVEDLDVPDTPENILMKAVTSEDTQDRADHAILTPWLRFLWESYRNCVDLLKNNRNLEVLYHKFVKQAFSFCVRYDRKSEFRKLADLLRAHFKNISQFFHNLQINLRSPETQALHLDTRMEQLDSAIKMELWQEAFKTIEDIRGILGMMDSRPKDSWTFRYYNSMADVFFQCGAQLFHACALYRSYRHVIEKKKIKADEAQLYSSRLTCAVLSIPLHNVTSRSQVEGLLELNFFNPEKIGRVVAALEMPYMPTRQHLIRDLRLFNVVSQALPEVKDLYRWLEDEFHPLQLTERVNGCLEKVRDAALLGRYVPALRKVAVTNLLKQLSQVYVKVELSRLQQLCTFYSRFELERFIVELARNAEIEIMIDHRSSSLSFESSSTRNIVDRDDSQQCGFEMQVLGADKLRQHLSVMAEKLERAFKLVNKEQIENNLNTGREHSIKVYMTGAASKEHDDLLKRQKRNEDIKSFFENLLSNRRQQQEAAEQNLRLEREREEQDRLSKEVAARKKKIAEATEREQKEILWQQRMLNLRKLKAFDKLDDEELGKIVKDEQTAVRQHEALRAEWTQKVARQKLHEKKVDHFIRAQRIEELTMLEKLADDETDNRRQFWEQFEDERCENAEQELQLAAQHGERFRRMHNDLDEWLDKIRAETRSDYKKRLADWEEEARIVREEMLQKRREKRILQKNKELERQREQERIRELDQKRMQEKAKQFKRMKLS